MDGNLDMYVCWLWSNFLYNFLSTTFRWTSSTYVFKCFKTCCVWQGIWMFYTKQLLYFHDLDLPLLCFIQPIWSLYVTANHNNLCFDSWNINARIYVQALTHTVTLTNLRCKYRWLYYLYLLSYFLIVFYSFYYLLLCKYWLVGKRVTELVWQSILCSTCHMSSEHRAWGLFRVLST